MSVAAILLAAGASRRLGQPKQLLRLNGETLLARMLRLAHESGSTPVLVVLGAYRDVICRTVEIGDAIIVANDQWEQGIATSIRAGLRVLEESSAQIEGVLVMSCDQPRLTADHLRSLLEAFAEKAETAIVASAYAGVQGVPAIFPRAAFAELSQLRGDKGARGFLAEPSVRVVSVQFEGGEIDIDLPSDIEKIG